MWKEFKCQLKMFKKFDKCVFVLEKISYILKGCEIYMFEFMQLREW